MSATSGRWPTGSPAGCASWSRAAPSSCSAIRDALISRIRASPSAHATSCRRAASSKIAIAARRSSGSSYPGERSAGLVREPVSEDLRLRISAFFEPCPDRVDGLAMLPEIIRCQLCGSADPLCDHCLDFTSKAGAVLQDILDFRPRFADRCPPARARLRRRRGFELQEVSQDPSNLRAQFAPIRLSQAHNLLGEVLPIERQIGTLGAPQRGRLLLGPAHEILVVERLQLRHILVVLD